MPRQRLLDVIVGPVSAHTPIGFDPSRIGPPVDGLHPSIRVDRGRKGRQTGQGGMRLTRRLIMATAPLMGALLVGVVLKLLSNAANLFKCPRTMHQETFLFVRPMGALHITVQIWSMRGEDVGLDPDTVQKLAESRG